MPAASDGEAAAASHATTVRDLAWIERSIRVESHGEASHWV